MFKETHITGSCFLWLTGNHGFCSLFVDELCEFSESVLWPHMLGNKKAPSDHRMRAESPWMPRITETHDLAGSATRYATRTHLLMQTCTSVPGHIYIYRNMYIYNIFSSLFIKYIALHCMTFHYSRLIYIYIYDYIALDCIAHIRYAVFEAAGSQWE